MDNQSIEETSDFSSLYEFPLSPGQAALWFHHQIAPQSVAYNLAVAISVPADTDVMALQRAFQKLSARHAMLRTLFAEKNGQPYQYVQPSISIDFQSQDTSEWGREQLHQKLESDVYRPFDLTNGPTWRVSIYEHAPIEDTTGAGENTREHLVLLTLHHILVDLWSITTIFTEIAAYYQEEITGNPASLKPPRLSFVEHVREEHERLKSFQAEISWKYWRSYLSGELSPLPLPTDRPHPSTASGRGAVHTLFLDQALTQALRHLADQEQVALYSVLLSAFQTLLHRYTDQNQILVGFPKAGRSVASIRTIGYFVNQTIVRSDFSENPPFNGLLRDVHTSIHEGASHHWYPFSHLVQRLQPTRDTSRSPLIQVVFSWQQAPRLVPRESVGAFALGLADRTIQIDGLRLRSYHLPFRMAAFDMTVLAAELPGGLALSIEYATDLFNRATIERMAACYRTLLESIVATPDVPVTNLTLLPEVEQAQLVSRWNETSADYPRQYCLHQCFEQQVQRTPLRFAVQDGAKKLIYEQLNRDANRLAHFLQAQGIGPDALVGVCLEPSIQMVAALLGILKAGGAYLPLDPDYPRDRLAYMLADAQPDLVLTRQGLCQRLPESQRLICIDIEDDQWRSLSQENPASGVTPDHLAYVIYTSGSTGQPKGASLMHRGVVSLLADFQRRQPILPGDACSWWTSPSFDVSVYEMFSPLLAGGCLVIVPPSIRLNSGALLDWVKTHSINSAYLPPFLLPDLANWLEANHDRLALRRLLVGVEPILHSLLTRILAQQPDLRIINGYGPTETTICSTLFEIDPTKRHPGITPIGRPAANTQVLLLDVHQNLVPIGAVGEIYIGGVGLARGYYHHPELTADRFVESPFRPGERLYRTGDLARYLPDGNLLYIGRVDTQVKLHGMRIELSEIEATLNQHPQVKQAAVILQEQRSGAKSLVAYIIPNQTPPIANDLRHYLIQRLPQTMVPTAFVVMESFPLTPTGKLDRKAFLLLDHQQTWPKNRYHAPQTATEQRLVMIWQQVLQVEPIGVEDNFFELGGDSILSLQVVARARELGLQINAQSVFQMPTIAQLSVLADQAWAAQYRWEMPDPGKPVTLTPIQSWFFEQNFTNSHHWNQSQMFATNRALDPDHLRSAVAALIRHHDALRLRFNYTESGWQQTVMDFNVAMPYEVIDLAEKSAAEQLEEIERQTVLQQRSLNLQEGPLVRFIYFDLGKDRPGRLLVVAHHLVVDGVSWRILLEDLQSAYGQTERGQAIRLPAETTPYLTWAQCLVSDTTRADQGADVWQRISEAYVPALPLDLFSPIPFDNVLNTEDTAQHVAMALSPEETQLLLRKVHPISGVEVPVLLLTALIRVLQRWIGATSLRIDLEGHGREELFADIDLTRTVGWFTALYPIRFELPINARMDQSINMIKEQLDNVPLHGIGYGLLRYASLNAAIREKLKTAPSASILFNYLGQLPQPGPNDLFSFTMREPVVSQRSPRAVRPYPFEIDVFIEQGVLQIDWIYSTHLHTRQTVAGLAQQFIAELQLLIRHCLFSQLPGATLARSSVVAIDSAEPNIVSQGCPKWQQLISKRDLEAVYPLSPMQQGMLFHTLYAPYSGAYFQQILFTLQGGLDIETFENAWRKALDRHAILRTAFIWQGLDQMLQVVYPQVNLPLTFQDWRAVPKEDLQDLLDRLRIAERSRGFDLSHPPLWRLVICQIAADTFQILFNHHHALLDGWSLPLLFQEVFTTYASLQCQQNLSLPPERPYQDYISWLQTRDLSAAKAFWRRELEGFVPVPFPVVQPADVLPIETNRPTEIEAQLPVEITNRLSAFARQNHLTISTLMQGAWAILLSRHLHCDDLLFGITVAGRPAEIPESVTMVGLFINTLPLRIRMAPQVRLSEWLEKIQQKANQIQQFDFSPLAQIKAWSQITHTFALFDTLLVVENYPGRMKGDLGLENIKITGFQSFEQAPYPITMAVTPGKQINLKILYDPARFEMQFISSILQDLRLVLERMIEEGDQSLSAFYSNQAQDISEAIGRAVLSDLDAQPRHICDYLKDAPDNGLEAHLVEVWKRLLKVDHVGIHDNFFELGGDSLIGAVCTYQLQETLHETILLSAIFESPTIFELARYLEKNHPAGVARFLGTSLSNQNRSITINEPFTLVPIQPEGSKPPLFCVHPAGGIVFPYYTLAHYLGKEQPLYGIQDPSQFNPELSSKNIETMASDYLAVIQTVQPEGPYYLLGWSIGGLVAYEMAQQLSRQGQAVASLIMLDTSSPVRNQQQKVHAWLEELLARFRRSKSVVRAIANYVRSGLYLMTIAKQQGKMHTQKDLSIFHLLVWVGLDTWRMQLLKEAEVANIVSPETSLLLYQMPAVRRVLELVGEHGKLAHQYIAQPYPGRITLFRAVLPGTKEPEAEDPTAGWSELAQGGVEVHTIPANHVALMVKPSVEILAHQLTECLDRNFHQKALE